jgi:hypothetical protein
VFENRLLREYLDRREISEGGRRNLPNEELHNLYSSPSIIRMIKSRRMRWAGHVVRMGEKMNEYKMNTRPLGTPGRTWVDNIKIDLREIGWYGMDLIDLVQDWDQWKALVNTVMNLRVP